MSNQDRDPLFYLENGFLKLYRVSPYETDGVGRLKIGSIFNWLQDSMDEYSTALGVGADYCQKHDISYALRSYDVSVSSLPSRGEVVPMRTRLKCLTPISFLLQQTMYEPSLRRSLLSSCSEVILLNASNGHWVRSKTSLPNYIIEGTQMGPYVMSEAPRLEHIDNVRDEVVPWDYIDFNRHVNNSRYVEMAARGVSPVRLKEMQLRRIAATFKRAAKYGEHLQVQTQIDPLSSRHTIVPKDKGDTPYARVYFEWQKKQMLCREKYNTREEDKMENNELPALCNVVERPAKRAAAPIARRGGQTYVY